MRSPPLVVGAAAVLFTAHRLWLHATVARRVSYEDQTLLWTVARDIRRGEIHQLDFPGQLYGSSLEAFPAALLGGLGMSDALALSLTLLALQAGPWLALSFVTYRRGQPLLAVLALCAPVVMTIEYSAFSIMWATAAGRALAISAAAISLTRIREPIRVAVVAALAGVAILVDTSTALLVVPTGVILFGDVARSLRNLAAAAGGIVVPVAWFLSAMALRDGNPHFDLHPAPSTRLLFKSVRYHFENPTVALQSYGPGVFASVAALQVLVVLTAIATVIYVAARSGRRSCGLGGLSLLMGLAVFFASEASLRSVEFDAVLLPRGRGLMALPAALVVVLAASARQENPLRVRHGIALLAVAVVAFFGSIVSEQTDRFVSEALEGVAVSARSIAELESACDELDLAVDEFAPDALLLTDATVTYACSALVSTDPPILFPTYERRTWAIEPAIDNVGTRWIIAEGGIGGCAFVPSELTCRPALSTSELLLVSSKPMTMPELIGLLGRPLRPNLLD